MLIILPYLQRITFEFVMQIPPLISSTIFRISKQQYRYYYYSSKKQEMSTYHRLFGASDQRSNTSHQRVTLKNYSFSPLDKIGKGFSATVYKGINELTKQTVAVKAVDMKGIKDKASRQMLQFEIEALKSIDHRNVLRCFDVIRQTSHCYIITQYCNQGDLLSILRKKRSMTQSEVSPIIKDIVEGFIQIGQNKFLHRDLKLANIFVRDGVAKIADFGFAKKSHSLYEKERYNVGSPLYMSPEALKKNIYTQKNDIWSIGIMVYELLHGDTPWKCSTQSELMDKMVRIPVSFKVKVSEEIQSFIKKCLEVDEQKRMSFSDLKEWSARRSKGTSQDLTQKHRQAFTQRSKVEVLRPLNDATNHISTGGQKGSKWNTSMQQKQKQNIKPSSIKLEKQVIDKNNSLILTEINRFRLIFKIYEKLKIVAPEEKGLMQALGSEITKKVANVSNILLEKNEKTKSTAQTLGLKEITLYVNEEANSSLQKYRKVMLEYKKKYSSEVSHQSSANYCLKTLVKKYMNNDRLSRNLNENEHLLLHWMGHSLELTPSTTKSDLDKIIEAKQKLSQSRLLRIVDFHA